MSVARCDNTSVARWAESGNKKKTPFRGRKSYTLNQLLLGQGIDDFVLLSDRELLGRLDNILLYVLQTVIIF